MADPEELELKRVDTTLGLRGSIRFYNDLVAPGIGGVRFVRQLTWSCLAIRYAQEIGVSPIKLGNAIEALGLKAHYNSLKDEEYTYRGSRAFERTSFDDVNTFVALSNKKNYVQITYRQNTSRTLTQEDGLGLTDSGAGFESFTLSPAGIELVEAHQSNYSRSISGVLREWVKIGAAPSKDAAKERFGPQSTKAEREVILKRLTSEITGRSIPLRGDFGRRRTMIALFHDLKEIWDISEFRNLCSAKGYNSILEDFNKAIDFFDMLHAGQNVLAKIYDLVDKYQGELSLSCLEINEEIALLVKSCKKYLDGDPMILEAQASGFASFIIREENNSSSILAEVIRRDSRVCIFTDDKILKGPLYRSNVINLESLVQSIPSTLSNFYSLWRECR
jgi:hypothetical protein